jgi:hypothetical protein
MRLLLLTGVLAAAAWSVWQTRQARRAGAALSEAMTRDGPSSSGPAMGARDSLSAAAEAMRDGRFQAAVDALAPPAQLSSQDLEAAKRFLGERGPLRQRLLDVTKMARESEQEGGDTAVIRTALARGLAAAARGDASSLTTHLDAAESALDPLAGNRARDDLPTGEAGIAARVAQLRPAVQLGQELLTEGHAAAARLIGRAAWHCQSEQYAEAAALLDMAAQLLGVQPTRQHDAKQLPPWFTQLAQEPSSTADPARTQAAVQLIEAVIQSETPGPALEALVVKARRELNAGRVAEASWWAEVALEALAMDVGAAMGTPANSGDRSQDREEDGE